MPVSSVRLVVNGRDVELSPDRARLDAVAVEAAVVVLEVSAPSSRTVTLDGRRLRLTQGTVGLLTQDFTRSTGYHRLTVDGADYWFATQDSKLGLPGIEEMLTELRSMGTGWGGQAIFSDGRGFRDPHVVYAWLDEWATPTLDAIQVVLAGPRSATEQTRALRRRGGPGVLVSQTLRLFRSDPKRYLAEQTGGPVHAFGQDYEPLRVVARSRMQTFETAANRRVVAVLRLTGQLVAEVLRSAPNDANTVTACRLWQNRVNSLFEAPLAQRLGLQPFNIAAPRQTEELTEPAYGQVYSAAQDARRSFGWNASGDDSTRLSFVHRADSIYQAYVASRFAAALGLTQTSPVLGAAQPAFRGPDFDLYYDTPPTAAVLRSWRLGSSVPDDSRPDLMLVERASGRVALLDAKYRVAKDGGATEDSRKEVSAYMGLYGLHGVTIVHPGALALRTVEAAGNQIVEGAVRPGEPLSAGLVDAVKATFEAGVY